MDIPGQFLSSANGCWTHVPRLEHGGFFLSG